MLATILKNVISRTTLYYNLNLSKNINSIFYKTTSNAICCWLL